MSGSDVISSVTGKYKLDQQEYSSISHLESESESTSLTLKGIKTVSKKESSSSSSSSRSKTEKSSSKDPIESWGKPLGLPSPILPPSQVDGKSTPKKQLSANVVNKNKINQEKSKEAKRAAESPTKKKSPAPIYMDLTYVPHHGNSYYSAIEFFKRVRARYYVFSGTEPSKEIYNALLDAKKTWEDKDLGKFICNDLILFIFTLHPSCSRVSKDISLPTFLQIPETLHGEWRNSMPRFASTPE